MRLPYYAGILTVWLLACIIGFAVLSTRTTRHIHRDQCVVCKPSGKLAMWGECE